MVSKPMISLTTCRCMDKVEAIVVHTLAAESSRISDLFISMLELETGLKRKYHPHLIA